VATNKLIPVNTSQDTISIRGARVHNLKNISLEVPHNAITVVTGVSGSGKSSLAFDTIYAEGQRRYVESLSAYARQFLERMEKPDVDEISGIAPAVPSVRKIPRASAVYRGDRYGNLRLFAAAICALRSDVLHKVRCRGAPRQSRSNRAQSSVARARAPVLRAL